MVTQRQAAQRLDISVEMAKRNGIPAKISEAQLAQIDREPPAWLVQSRANRTGKRPVWVELQCDICGFAETLRPKKWWPEFTYVTCAEHGDEELPEVAPGMYRREADGIGARFIGVIDRPEEA